MFYRMLYSGVNVISGSDMHTLTRSREISQKADRRDLVNIPVTSTA